MVKISKNPSKIHTPNNEMQPHRPSFYKRDTSYPARTKPRQRRSGLRIEARSFRGIRLCPECVPSLCKRLRKYTFYFQERESDRTKISACENTVIILMYRYSSSPAAFRTTPRSLRRDGNCPGRLLYYTSRRREKKFIGYFYSKYRVIRKKGMGTRRVLRTRHKNTRTRERWNSAARPMTGLYGHWKIRTTKAGNGELSR